MLKKSLILAASLLAFNASAGMQTWSFDKDGTPLNNSHVGNQIVMLQDGITMTVTGWADSLGATNTSDPNSEVVEAAKLVFYGDTLGLQNRDEIAAGDTGTPEHSIDNYDPAKWGDDYEMVLLEFSTAVNLLGYNVGWAREGYEAGVTGGSRHADITTVAYTGPSGPNAGEIEGFSWAQIAANSAWSLVEQAANVDDYSYHALSTAITSRFWLIGAYNPIWDLSHWSSDNDGFKLAGVKTQHIETPPSEVPEPATLAVLLAGLLGLSRFHRKV